MRSFIIGGRQVGKPHLHGVVHGILSSVMMWLSPGRRLPLIPTTYRSRTNEYRVLSTPMAMLFTICACQVELLIPYHCGRYVRRV